MRRFIAGAVCPQCRSLDRIVLSTTDTGEDVQRCVACGYEALRPAGSAAMGGVPRGRPERRPSKVSDVKTQTVKIMDLQPKSDLEDESK